MTTGKGQISAEMIIIIAVVLAVAILLATQLYDTAKEGNKRVDKSSEDVFDKIDDIGNLSKSNAIGQIGSCGAECLLRAV
ncbi:MAG: class III signal peptide-containing protein [Candidatus Micrarchaeota archaeon]